MSRSEFLRQAAQMGWRYEGDTGNGHIRLIKAGRRPQQASKSPSDPNAYRVALRWLRKADAAAGEGHET